MMLDMERRKAILVDLISPRTLKGEALDRLRELEQLVNTFGDIVIVKSWQKRFAPHPKTYVGTGKVQLLGEEAVSKGATVLIINDKLKPRQVYDIGESMRPFGVQVWDRIDLILKIFGKHAKTAEAKLEIELASVRHMGPRIFGMGMELSRQGGGVGTRGLGETNTQRMKRHLKEKERRIKEKLDKCKKQRSLIQSGRRRRGLKTVSIVGYTNAGKTTLLNALTGRQEYAANELFATLDTRVGEIVLPGTGIDGDWGQKVLVSDTIGFIRDLPPELLSAFTSTLSEAVEADVLLHVVDASEQDMGKHIQVVNDILERLALSERKKIIVFNKIDDVEGLDKARMTKAINHDLEAEPIPVVFVSAMKKEGFDELTEAIRSAV